MKVIFIFLILTLSLFSFISADKYSDCSIYGNCKPVITASGGNVTNIYNQINATYNITNNITNSIINNFTTINNLTNNITNNFNVSEVDPIFTGYLGNGTLGLNSTFNLFYPLYNPYGYYNITSFNINNYYLNSNPFNFYNSTTLNDDSQLSNGAGYLVASSGDLGLTNNANYWNATYFGGIGNYSSNYSIYGKYLNWSDLNNGTFTGSGISWATATNGTLLLSAFASNNSFYPYSTNPFNYYNSTTLPASSGNVVGVGSFDYIPMWNGTTTQNTSAIYQNGSNIGFWTINPNGFFPNSKMVEINDTEPILKLRSSLNSGQEQTWLQFGSAGASQYVTLLANRSAGLGIGMGTMLAFSQADFVIDTNGNVGIGNNIGTTTLQNKLNVVGDANVTTSLYQNSGQTWWVNKSTTTTNSTQPSLSKNITGTESGTLNANTWYNFECKIVFSANKTAAGIRLAMNSTAVPSFISYDIFIPTNTLTGLFNSTSAIGIAQVSSAVPVLNTNYTAKLEGTYFHTASSILFPTWGSTLISTSANVSIGSNCRYEKIT